MNESRIEVLDRQVLSEEWARLERVRFRYRHSSGQWTEQIREVYDRGHGAAILLYSPDRGCVVLIRQFRLPAWEIDDDGFLLEVPAGVVEAEMPDATIRREVVEETGFHVDEPEYLFTAFVSPGSVTERIHYYIARYDESDRRSPGGGAAEEGEDIDVLEMPFYEAFDGISTGRIVDAKTILLLQYARLHLFPESASAGADSRPAEQ